MISLNSVKCSHCHLQVVNETKLSISPSNFNFNKSVFRHRLVSLRFKIRISNSQVSFNTLQYPKVFENRYLCLLLMGLLPFGTLSYQHLQSGTFRYLVIVRYPQVSSGTLRCRQVPSVIVTYPKVLLGTLSNHQVSSDNRQVSFIQQQSRYKQQIQNGQVPKQ